MKKLDANMIEDTQLTDHTVIINFMHFEVNTINFLPNLKECFFKVNITNNSLEVAVLNLDGNISNLVFDTTLLTFGCFQAGLLLNSNLVS